MCFPSLCVLGSNENEIMCSIISLDRSNEKDNMLIIIFCELSCCGPKLLIDEMF